MTDIGITTTEKIIPGLLLMMIINTYEYVSLFFSSKITSKRIRCNTKIFFSRFSYMPFLPFFSLQVS